MAAANAAGWPPSLCSAVEISLASPLGMLVLAGPELQCACNRAGAAVLGEESGLDGSPYVPRPLLQRWPQAQALADAAARVLASGHALITGPAELALSVDGVGLHRCVSLACSPLGLASNSLPAGVLVVLIEHANGGPLAANAQAHRQPQFPLTTRETEILKLIGAGLQVKQVANALAISVSSVNTYRNRIFRKTGLVSNAAVIRYALKNGLVS